MPNNRTRTRVVGILTAAMIAIGLGACSSTSVPPTTTTTTTLPSVAQSTAAVEHAYSVLFDLANPALAPKLAVIQDGSQLASAMKTALKSPLAAAAGGASVSKVVVEQGAPCKNEFLPSPCAKVTYEILSPQHAVVLHYTEGLAVYQHSKWVVAKLTICVLLELENSGKVPPGC
ncbi:MAG: hypothetical protein ABSD85_00400 [Acidimicrobiales bacterium]